MGIKTTLLLMGIRIAFMLLTEESKNNFHLTALYFMSKAFTTSLTSLQYIKKCCSSLV